MKKSGTLLESLVRLTLRYPATVLLLAAILTALAVFFTYRIKIRSNFSDLLPDNHPAVMQARELEKIVGGASSIVVAAETKDPDAAAAFLDDLKKKVLLLEGIRYVDDRPPAGFLKKNSLLYLSPEDLDRMAERIRKKIEKAKLKKGLLYIDFEESGQEEDEISRLREKYGTFIQP